MLQQIGFGLSGYGQGYRGILAPGAKVDIHLRQKEHSNRARADSLWAQAPSYFITRLCIWSDAQPRDPSQAPLRDISATSYASNWHDRAYVYLSPFGMIYNTSVRSHSSVARSGSLSNTDSGMSHFIAAEVESKFSMARRFFASEICHILVKLRWSNRLRTAMTNVPGQN